MPYTPSADSGGNQPDLSPTAPPSTTTVPVTVIGDLLNPPVDVTDVPVTRTHHPGDVLLAVLTTLGVVVIMLMATYAHNTTNGVEEDVQGFATLLRQLLFFPVTILAAGVTLLTPVAVTIELAIRRQGRQLLLMIAAAAAAVLLNATVTWAIEFTQADDLRYGLSVWLDGTRSMTLPHYVALLAALLTVAGPHERRRTVPWFWNALWVVIGITIITGQVSIPGIAISLLLGRATGLVFRHLSGIEPEQAYGQRLVAGVQRTGFSPKALVRIPDPTSNDFTLPAGDPRRAALARSIDGRVYRLLTQDGRNLDLIVLDGDRQVIGMLQRTWRSIRLRGLDGRRVVSLRQAAERAALLTYAAQAAGVRTPRLLSMSEVDDSMLLVSEHPTDAVPFTDLDPEQISDTILADLWTQLNLAHQAGIAHRALTSDAILVSSDFRSVWITNWDSGDVASSELARRIDLAQALALVAVKVGASKALETASGVLSTQKMASVGPMLQSITLPRLTRMQMQQQKQVLSELRTAIVSRLPEADVEPQQLVRFGARTVITAVLIVGAAVAVLAGINVNQIGEALTRSDWRWSLVSFAMGMVTLLGAALALVAFAPVKVGLWQAIKVQTAATFVALAAPAGIGPAALNLRALTRRGVSTTVAAATVGLVQVSQFVMTLLVLLVLSMLPGGMDDPLSVSPTILIAVGISIGLVAVALLIPRVRNWALARLMPTVRQTWPRLLEVLGQPWRLTLGLTGNLIMTLGYILAFDAALRAFGQNVDLIQVAVVYLAGNTAGAALPTPGGIGAVEIGLIGGLTGIGVNPGVAASVAVLFRVLTYWMRIPFGWFAMHSLQRHGDL